MSEDLQRRILEQLAACAGPLAGARLGVAVSGGSDSIALLVGLHALAGDMDVTLNVATVDHGLRAEAQYEVAFVAALCAQLSLPHHMLRWNGRDADGNLQDQARRARYRLLSDWAKDRGLSAVALGHTQDDQAETVLMRLARGSGVAGLAAMSARTQKHGIDFLRPLLGVSRASLRQMLTAQGQAWCEDPSNQDPQFERVRMRQALDQLTPLGVTTAGLAEVAEHMQMADLALRSATASAAADLASTRVGAVRIERAGFIELPQDIQRRLVIAAIGWINGNEYPPRKEAVRGFLSAVQAGKSMTLGGCLAVRHGRAFWIGREFAALSDRPAPVDAHWDGRWVTTGTVAPEAVIRPLGDTGLAAVQDWRAFKVPKPILQGAPGVWLDDSLVATPMGDPASSAQVRLVAGRDDFAAHVLSH